MDIAYRMTKLSRAIAEDRAAKNEALQMGLVATQPLTATRLDQLCALGEKMMHAARRVEEAERMWFIASGGAQDPVDIVLPDLAH
jgi:hypothetical protein